VVANPMQNEIHQIDLTLLAAPLNSAIQSKDGTPFAKAYAELTDACNSCHQALNHGVVQIRVPSRTSPSDLDTDSASRN